MKNRINDQITPALDLRQSSLDSGSPSAQPIELLASWGDAKVYKDLDGNCRLMGGSAEDQAAAQKWIELFVTTCLTKNCKAVPASSIRHRASTNHPASIQFKLATRPRFSFILPDFAHGKIKLNLPPRASGRRELDH